MVELLYLILAIAVIFLTFLIFQAVGGVIFGGKIEEIGIGNGSSIFKIPLGKIVLSVNYFPFGCYVKFTEEFFDLHPFRKILTVLSGLLSYFFLAIVCLGFSEAISQTISGFPQTLKMIFSPIDVGAKYIGTALNLVNDKSFVYELGIVATKLLAFNLFPLGTLSGGILLIYFFEFLGFRSEKVIEKYKIISLLIQLIIFIMIIISTVTYLFKG